MKIREKQIEVLDTFDMGSNYVRNVLDPVNAQDAATKAYVDAVVQGLSPKDSVKYATIPGENINLATDGLVNVTIDGATLTLTDGDRILVKNQTDDSENGIYLARSGAWERASDADVWTDLVSAFTFVEQGVTNGDSGWICTADTGGTLETTPITWSQFSSAGSYSADGEGIELAGTVFSLELDGTSMSKSASGVKSATQAEVSFTSLTPTGSPASTHDTGVTLSETPAGNCDVTVLLNGIVQELGFTTNSVFFFTPDSGSSARSRGNASINDELYFNPTAAEFTLDATDTITLVYSKIW
jgi:hypothetical protein